MWKNRTHDSAKLIEKTNFSAKCELQATEKHSFANYLSLTSLFKSFKFRLFIETELEREHPDRRNVRSVEKKKVRSKRKI